jgi:antitoxin HicB
MATATDVSLEKTEGVGAYLKRPYTRLVVPEPDGTFRCEVLEFPGCLATGDTPAEAYEGIEEAATDWIAAALERGQNIPEPFENLDFSGRLVLRLPKSLHRKAALCAERDRTSLNQLIVAAVSEYVGEQTRPQNPGAAVAVTDVGIQRETEEAKAPSSRKKGRG